MSRPMDEEREGEAAIRSLLVGVVLVTPFWVAALVWWLLSRPLAWWLVS